MKFTKMHGLGNNYIFVNQFEEQLEDQFAEQMAALARRVSNVHTGIGSDGLILIGPSNRADFRMRIFNSDGSEGKNCGNGVRCLARYVYERGLTKRTSFSVETLGGIVAVSIDIDPAGGAFRSITVDMGRPRLLKKDIPMTGDPESLTLDEPMLFIDDKLYRFTAVSMGNPHAVLFVTDLASVPLQVIGPKIECAPLFPERINVEFVRVRNQSELDFRVWERGSGITQACGTGACAAVVAGVLNGFLERGVTVVVHLEGGDLEIKWDRDSHVYMKGPAEFVADGQFYV